MLSDRFYSLASLGQHQKLFDKKLTYGTAGFRDDADALPLDSVMFRVGCIAGIRARVLAKATGVMITASHNEEKDNGCKIVDPDGGMLAECWEAAAEAAANSVTTDELSAVLSSLLSSTSLNSAIVFIGYDTRKSSERLTRCVLRGIQAVGCVAESFGLVTTPILHHLVRHANGFGSSVALASLQGYFDLLVESFKIVGGPVSATPRKVLVDCAGGVGSMSIQKLQPLLKGYVDLIPVNLPGEIELNGNCGAEFVQKGRKAPQLATGFETGVVASLDGDADRLVYSYFDQTGTWKLLDGDKIGALFAFFINEKLRLIGWEGVDFVAVQTAYANGASTEFLRARGVKVELAKTGVKYVEAVAHKHDIGMYFEANGHGTVCFKHAILDRLKKCTVVENLTVASAARSLLAFANLLNQAVGDAVCDLLAVEAILNHFGMSVENWEAFYTDLPSRQGKVIVPDRAAVKCSEDETQVIAPEALASAIKEVCLNLPKSRAFVRPSGTENAVRIYAEAANQDLANSLAFEVAKRTVDILGGSYGVKASDYGLG